MLRFYIFILLALFSRSALAQTEPVKLRWVNIPYATSYDIEIESLGSKGRPLVNRTVNIPELAVDLPPGAYVYRVRGVAEKGKGPWSDKQPFDVKVGAIALLSPPVDFKVEAGTKIDFNWKTVSGYRYRIQIANAKKILSDREVTDGSFTWTSTSAGNFRWRVAYVNVSDTPWTEFRAFRVTTPANLAVNTRVEKPRSHWAKKFWAGAYMNSFAGDFADAGNNVTASTVSGNYAFELERRHEHFSPYSEPRPSLTLGVKQQSLVKKTVWLPDLELAYKHLWSIRYLKLGPLVDGGYGKTGFFTADVTGNYDIDSFWRTYYAAGVYGEYLFKKVVLNSYVKFGGASGAHAALAPGGIKPASTLEAALGAKLADNSRWSLQLRWSKEDVKWTSAIGNNSLTSHIWSLALGGEL